MGVAAAVLLGSGLILMIVPPVVRDGLCGLTSCADRVPVIAVSRVSPTELAVVVPDDAAPNVRRVELLQGGSSGSGSRQWMIRAERGSDTGSGSNSGSGSGSAASARTFLIGDEPDGFRTVVPLETEPQKGVWTAQVGFRCTTASLPFNPQALAVGEVRSWDGVMDGNDFASDANTSEHCLTERGTAELGLLLAGAALAVAGAVLGIVVVLRRPARFPEDGDDPVPTSEHDQDPDRV